MSLLEDILAAVTSGLVLEPFSAADLAQALRERDWSRGSYAALLSRHARSGGAHPPLFLRVGRGRYRLAPGAVRRDGDTSPSTDASAGRADTSEA